MALYHSGAIVLRTSGSSDPSARAMSWDENGIDLSTRGQRLADGIDLHWFQPQFPVDEMEDAVRDRHCHFCERLSLPI
jgi:hypothetical protein